MTEAYDGRQGSGSTCTAPRFPDREFAVNSRGFLPIQVLVHDFLRSPVTESRVETSLIIAKLDPPRNVFPCLLAGGIDGAVNELDLQRPVDRFRQGTMPFN